MSSFSPESTSSSPAERKLRHYVERRRRSLRTLADLLEHQRRAIVGGDIDMVEYYTALERDALDDLRTLEAVIASMSALLPHAPSVHHNDILTHIDGQQRRNRSLLTRRIEATAHELQGLRIPRTPRHVYERPRHGGAMVDVTL